jgi:hypothetical protein
LSDHKEFRNLRPGAQQAIDTAKKHDDFKSAHPELPAHRDDRRGAPSALGDSRSGFDSGYHIAICLTK